MIEIGVVMDVIWRLNDRNYFPSNIAQEIYIKETILKFYIMFEATEIRDFLKCKKKPQQTIIQQ